VFLAVIPVIATVISPIPVITVIMITIIAVEIIVPVASVILVLMLTIPGMIVPEFKRVWLMTLDLYINVGR
jgi:hypothetical protein